MIEARNNCDMSINTAVDALGIARGYLSMLENGKKQPSNEMIARMSELYGQPAAFFLNKEHQSFQM